MKIVILAGFLLLNLNLQANENKQLPFSGGKYGKYAALQTEKNVKNATNIKRANCYTNIWLHGNLSYYKWNYLLYQKVEVSASSTSTYGTPTSTCNIPYYTTITAKVTAGVHDGYAIIGENQSTLYSSSTTSTSFSEEAYLQSVYTKYAWSYHTAGPLHSAVSIYIP